MIGYLKYMITGRRKNPPPRAQILAARPLRNPAVVWERGTRDEARPNIVLLRVPRRQDRLGNLVARVFKLPDFRTVELDEIGSDVWEMCDGERSVDGLTRAICAQYRLNRRQAEASVTAYLRMLAEKHLVALRTKKSGRNEAAAKAGTSLGRRRKQA